MADLSLKQASALGPRPPLGAGVPFAAVSITLLVAVLAALGGLTLLNRQREAQREEFIRQNKIKEESLRPELLAQIVALEGRLKGIRALLSRHEFSSNALRLVEADTHPQVQFSSFAFSADNLKVELGGQAASYRVLARQITFFENDPQVEAVEFGGLSAVSSGLIGFHLAITLKPGFTHIRELQHASSEEAAPQTPQSRETPRPITDVPQPLPSPLP